MMEENSGGFVKKATLVDKAGREGQETYMSVMDVI